MDGTKKPRRSIPSDKAGLWNFLAQHIAKQLRRLYMYYWKPKNDLLNQHVKVTVINYRKVKTWECWKCGMEVQDIHVDHIVPVGIVPDITNSRDDLVGYIDRLFCDVSNLQLICSDCHKEKTNAENLANRKARKAIRSNREKASEVASGSADLDFSKLGEE